METEKRSKFQSSWVRRQTITRLWIDYQWTAIGILAAIALALGIHGFSQYYASIEQPTSLLDLFYSAVQLFPLESGNIAGKMPWSLEAARWLAPGVLVYTAVKALLEIFRDQLQLFRVRLIRDHVVVCGLGEKGYALIKAFRAQGYRVVGVELDEQCSRIESCRELGAFILVGEAADPDRLARAGVARAKYLFSVCGDDSTNIAVAAHAKALVNPLSEIVLSCYTHVGDLDLAEMLREREISGQDDIPFRLEIFNIYQRGARALLSAHPLFPQLEDKAASKTQLVIVGVNTFGASLLIEAAKLWYIAFRRVGISFKVTLIDENIDTRWAELTLRYPQLEELECERIASDVRSAQSAAVFASTVGSEESRALACVCRDDDNQSLSEALVIRQHLRTRQVPVIICMHREAGVAALLPSSDEEAGYGSSLTVFDLIERTCTPDLLLLGTNEILARAIHDDYVQEQRASGQAPASNPSMCPWGELPETLQKSNRNQADHINAKLKAVGRSIVPLKNWDRKLHDFQPDDVETMAIMEHQRWVEEREADGWTYAEGDKDIEKKTSPYLIPWDDERLSEKIKDLDRNTVAHLPLFLAKAGFQIEK